MELDNGSYASPRWSYEILDCAMPMTFDTYSNCAHQCLYCFSFFQRAIGKSADDYLHHKVKAVNPDKIKRMFLEPDKYAGQFAPYIKKRLVLQWGGLSDGFDWYERKFRVSLELLRFFNSIDYPVSISTKGVWWLDDPEYVEAVRGRKNQHWKYSIITANEEHVKALEPGTPPAQARFAAMRKLNDLGVGATTLRFRPFVLGTSDITMEQMLQAAKDSGCISVTTEFLTWESRASNTSRERLDAMSKVLGYDVWQFYVDNSAHASGLLRLNYDLKRPYIKRMKELAEQLDLKFFVSDAHHKEDSYHAGCCGLPETGPLSNVNRGQYAHAIKLAKENGFVKWSDISQEAKDLLDGIPFYEAEGFPNSSEMRAKHRYKSMYDYMHDIWNNPKSWQSPARYFGGALVPSAPDENGDIVYLYNKPFVDEGVHVESVHELALQLRMAGKPNADRFDAMSANGTAGGHVAYPVVIFSSGRADVATTPKLLDRYHMNYQLAIPAHQAEEYAAAFPSAELLLVQDDANIAYARSEVCRTFHEDGTGHVWMLDDDITSFSSKQPNGTWQDDSPRAAMSAAEEMIERYDNIAVIGMDDTTYMLDEASEAYTVNTWRMNGAYLVDIQEDSDFGIMPVLEMKAYMLRQLSFNKKCTVRLNRYSLARKEGLHGGCTKAYIEGGAASGANILSALYPVHVGALRVTGSTGSSIVLSELEPYENALRSRAAVQLTQGENNAQD